MRPESKALVQDMERSVRSGRHGDPILADKRFAVSWKAVACMAGMTSNMEKAEPFGCSFENQLTLLVGSESCRVQEFIADALDSCVGVPLRHLFQQHLRLR